MKRRSLTLPIFLGMLFLQGCGYSLQMINAEEAQQQLNRQHEMEKRAAAFHAEVAHALSDTKKRQADIDLHMDEFMLQLRVIQGKIEKGDHRYEEIIHQLEDPPGGRRDLAELKTRVSEQERRLLSLQHTLKAEMEGMKGGVTGGEAKKIEGLAELSVQVSELTTRIDRLAQPGKPNKDGNKTKEILQIRKGLHDLSKALKQLGGKVTAKIDEHDRILRKLEKRAEESGRQQAPSGP